MTEIDTSREAIEKLLDGVTPGPWFERFRGDAVRTHWDPVADVAMPKGATRNKTPNARFIAASRELVPALLSRAEAAEAERDRLRGAWVSLAEHPRWELSWGALDETDEEFSEYGWRVHEESGGRNDREWELVGTGATPLEAVLKALGEQS